MKYYLLLFVMTLFSFGCQTSKGNEEINDLVGVQSVANKLEWIPLLESMDSDKPELKALLFEFVDLLSNLNHDIVTYNGGFNEKSLLNNPYRSIQISDSKLSEFFNEIEKKRGLLEKDKNYKALFLEINPVISFTFFNDKGLLCKSSILNSNVLNVSSKLLMYENYFYYLIVKYT